jgi:hypothetical protein
MGRPQISGFRGTTDPSGASADVATHDPEWCALVSAALTKELGEDVKTVQIGALAALAKVRGNIVRLHLYFDDVVGLAPMRDALRYVLKPFFVGGHQFMGHDSSEGLIIVLVDLREVRVVHEVPSSTPETASPATFRCLGAPLDAGRDLDEQFKPLAAYRGPRCVSGLEAKVFRFFRIARRGLWPDPDEAVGVQRSCFRGQEAAEGIGAPTREGNEGRIDLAARAGVEDSRFLNTLSHGPSTIRSTNSFSNPASGDPRRHRKSASRPSRRSDLGPL